jgi:hypothetical protein
MKRIIKLEYLKKYLSDHFWNLQNLSALSNDYYNIIFRVELDHALTRMEAVLQQESDICEVKDALRYILNEEDFDCIGLLKETTNLAYTKGKEARTFFLYMWHFLFDEPWDYAQDLNAETTIVLRDKDHEKVHVKDVISRTRWCDNLENNFWGDTQIFFNGDGTGVLCYLRPNKKNKLLFHFDYTINENEYTENTIITLRFPDINIAFEMAIHVTKEFKKIYQNRECSNTVLKFSDHPFLITQDFLNRRVHFPIETVFYPV